MLCEYGPRQWHKTVTYVPSAGHLLYYTSLKLIIQNNLWRMSDLNYSNIKMSGWVPVSKKGSSDGQVYMHVKPVIWYTVLYL